MKIITVVCCIMLLTGCGLMKRNMNSNDAIAVKACIDEGGMVNYANDGDVTFSCAPLTKK